MPIKKIQSSSASASRRILVILALILFIVALVLVIVSSFSSGFGKFTGSYKEGYLAAREQAYSAGLQRANQSNIHGTIQSVGNNELSVKTNFFVDARVDGVGRERTIVVDGSTKIIKYVVKDQDEYRKEQREFMTPGKDTNGERKSPPSPFIVQEVKLSDLKEGMDVLIMGPAGEDLTLVNPIHATRIEVSGN
jgi:hypothetical protein